MDTWRIGPRVAQPYIKALVIGSKGLRACDAIGDPAHGGVQDPMHEEDAVPCICTPNKPLRNTINSPTALLPLLHAFPPIKAMIAVCNNWGSG